MYMCEYIYMYVCALCTSGILRVHKRVSSHLKLELETLVSHLLLVLGTKPGSSWKSSSVLTTEPSLQPPLSFHLRIIFFYCTYILYIVFNLSSSLKFRGQPGKVFNN